MKNDAVNHPAHYTTGGIECIDAIRAALGNEGAIAFCRGAVMKYVWRAGKKAGNTAAEDLRKGAWYLTKAAEIQEALDAERAYEQRSGFHTIVLDNSHC